MSNIRSRTQVPVGSMQWIFDERRQAGSFVVQEVEEFQFSAQNDMEWLNEHMTDVFNRKQFDIAESFKTPGKLRGKTPRTARKRIGNDNRAPLSDVFSSNLPAATSSPYKTPFLAKLTNFQVAEDKDEDAIAAPITNMRYSFGMGKENTDSGYHGVTDDEMDLDMRQQRPTHQAVTKPPHTFAPPHIASPRVEISSKTTSCDESQDTFMSAEESQPNAAGNAHVSATSLQPESMDIDQDVDVNVDVPPQPAEIPEGLVARKSNQFSISASTEAGLEDALDQVDTESPLKQDEASVESTPSSEDSSPRRSVMRKKSSLTFAALPAREPLNTKQSMGVRTSRTSHLDQPRKAAATGESHFEKQSSSKAPVDRGGLPPMASTVNSQNVEKDSADELASEQDEITTSALLHSKTSTQRLQERLAMLGKPSAPRFSKSISASTAVIQTSTSKLAEPSLVSPTKDELAQEDIEESWISPIAKSPRKEIIVVQTETTKTTNPDVPRRRSSRFAESKSNDESDKVSYPVLPPPRNPARVFQDQNKAPAALPRAELHNENNNAVMNSSSVGRLDGPLSASKAKLFSVFKSAKGIFASSASASAQAKMNTSPLRQAASRPVTAVAASDTTPFTEKAPTQKPTDLSSTTGLEADDLPVLQKEFPKAPPPRRVSDRLKASTKADNGGESSKSRGHEDEVSKQKTAEGLKPSAAHVELQAEESDIDNGIDLEDFPPPPPPPKPQTSLLQRQGDLRRPGRPPKDAAQKTKPAPVSIKIRGFQTTQGMGHFGGTGRSATPSDQEPVTGPAVPPKAPVLSKKGSNSSINTASSVQASRTTASTTSRPKALEAAARKREQDEREAQRKAEQKREVERRRAAKIEEERRAAHAQKLAEQQANEAKQHAQKEAAELRKAEAIRRNEQLRNQAVNARMRPVEESSFAASNVRQAPYANQQRPETAAGRPISRMGGNTDAFRPAAPHVNPAKPPKRQFNADEDDDRIPGQHASRMGQTDSHHTKRRRTSEDSFVETISRPTMAPPKRPSTMRKEINARPAPVYASVSSQSQSSQPSQSMMKSVTTTQHQLQHPKTPHMNDLAHFSSAKIPFAESSQAGPSFSQQQHRMPTQFKTPGTHKSSPQYPNGDSIELPEIATDSEDSDDEDDFVPPDWANSPALRELLAQQQLVDPLKVFGPIAPLMMDEVFKGNKERLAKFRKRTSSANWNGADRLTEEERRKDREARERLERQGGWTFNPTPNK